MLDHTSTLFLAVREVFTEEVAKELGLEKEARWAGVARLTRAEERGGETARA